MAYAALILLWASVLFFLGAIGTGLHLFGSAQPLPFHFTIALVTLVIVCLAHGLALIYLRRVRRYAGKLLPWGGLAVLLVLVTFTLGALHYFAKVDLAQHAWAAYGALVIHVHVATKESWHILRVTGKLAEDSSAGSNE